MIQEQSRCRDRCTLFNVFHRNLRDQIPTQATVLRRYSPLLHELRPEISSKVGAGLGLFLFTFSSMGPNQRKGGKTASVLQMRIIDE